MNYIQMIENNLDKELHMKGTPYEELLGVYTLLVLTVGVRCTNNDVHNAWSMWQNKIDKEHRSLKWFNELTKEVKDMDEPYRQAIIKVAKPMDF